MIHPFFNQIGTYIRGPARDTDYLEFGTYVGSTLSAAYHSFKPFINRFFAFDSFQGLIGTREEESCTFQDGQYNTG